MIKTKKPVSEAQAILDGATSHMPFFRRHWFEFRTSFMGNFRDARGMHRAMTGVFIGAACTVPILSLLGLTERVTTVGPPPATTLFILVSILAVLFIWTEVRVLTKLDGYLKDPELKGIASASLVCLPGAVLGYVAIQLYDLATYQDHMTVALLLVWFLIRIAYPVSKTRHDDGLVLAETIAERTEKNNG